MLSYLRCLLRLIFKLKVLVCSQVMRMTGTLVWSCDGDCGALVFWSHRPELRSGLAMQWLVEAHICSSEPRGGEVRLDPDVPLRARAAHLVSVD